MVFYQVSYSYVLGTLLIIAYNTIIAVVKWHCFIECCSDNQIDLERDIKKKFILADYNITLCKQISYFVYSYYTIKNTRQLVLPFIFCTDVTNIKRL